MTLALSDTLYLALGCYALGTLAALLSLFVREKRLQHATRPRFSSIRWCC
jgi:hypothetical protein